MRILTVFIFEIFLLVNGHKHNYSDILSFIQCFTNTCFDDFKIFGQQKLSAEAIFCFKNEETSIKILRNNLVPIRFNKIQNLNASRLSTKNKVLILFDFECENAMTLFQTLKLEKVFLPQNLWVILKNQPKTELQNVSSFNPLPDSKIITAEAAENNVGLQINLNYVYRINTSSQLIFEDYGSWSSRSGLHFNQKDLIASRRRRNLQNSVFIASIVLQNNNTLMHLDDYRDKHIDSITKVNYILGKHLISSMNSTMVAKFVDTWGYRDPKTNKIQRGMIADLIYGKADIGGTPLFMSVDRVNMVDYVSMTTATRVSFIFREPPLSYVTNIYYLPFSTMVWICGTSLVVLSILILLLTTNLQISIRKTNSRESYKKFRFTDYIFIGISAVCQMGCLIQPRFSSAKISTIFLLIAMLFLYTSYTANIVALLQSTTKSIKTLSDLLNSPIKLAAEDTTYHRYYFPAYTEPVRRAIYTKKMLTKGKPHFINITTGIARVRKDFFAFHVELGAGYKLIKDTYYEHEKCNLKTIEFLQVVDPWFSVQKYSPYKEIIKVNLFKIREHGLQQKVQKKIYTEKPECSGKGQNFGSVRLNDCYAPFVIFFCGVGLSLVILILEKIFKNQNNLFLI